MKVREDDYKGIMDYLIGQRWTEGHEFVAYPGGDFPIEKEELACFGSDKEARAYCDRSSTDMERFDFMAIRSVYRAMSAGMDNPDLKIKKYGLVDVARMVTEYYGRLETRQMFNININNTMMNENNFNFLSDQVKYTGFGDWLQEDLRKAIESGKAEFKIPHKITYGADEVSATLNFSKSKESDMYFFNSYAVELKKASEKEAMTQTFFINKGSNITLKEAYNLMEGRSVNKNLTTKDGNKVNVWLQMDFKQVDKYGNHKLNQFHENYGFDLEAVLDRYPIKELENGQYRENLVESLKKGNLQSATFVRDEVEVKRHIEANPQFKTINVYDEGQQRIRSGQVQEHAKKEGQSEKNDLGKDKVSKSNKKQSNGSDTESDPPGAVKAAPKQRRKRGVSV